MTATSDLPTDRLRQLRDGHNPDDGHSGRARAARIARLQQQIIEADELATELGHYRQVARTLEVLAVGRLVDREVRRMIDRAIDYRNRCANELRALQ